MVKLIHAFLMGFSLTSYVCVCVFFFTWMFRSQINKKLTKFNIQISFLVSLYIFLSVSFFSGVSHEHNLLFQQVFLPFSLSIYIKFNIYIGQAKTNLSHQLTCHLSDTKYIPKKLILIDIAHKVIILQPILDRYL